MKILFISDIHANKFALSSVFNNTNKIKIDHVICLGDLCGYLTNVNDIVKLFTKHNVISLAGNHDFYFNNSLIINDSKIYSKSIKYDRENSDYVTKDFIYGLMPEKKIIIDKKKFNLFHGGPINHYDEKVYPDKINFSNYKDFKNEYFVFGHTHLQYFIKHEKNIFINPGSVGLPRNGDFRAHYILFDTENDNIDLLKCVYDVNKVINLYVNDVNVNKLIFHNILFGRTSSKMLKYWEPKFFTFQEEELLLKGRYNYFNTPYGIILSKLEDNFDNIIIYIISYLDGTIKITSNTLFFHWQKTHKTFDLFNFKHNYLNSDQSGLYYEEQLNTKNDLLILFNFKINNIFIKIQMQNHD